MVFSSISYSLWKGWKTHQMGKAWKLVPKKVLQNRIICAEARKLVLILFPWYRCSFLIRFTCFGILYMLNSWVSPSISHSMGKCSKSIKLGEPGKLVPIFSWMYGYFSSIRFRSYGILYHMGSAWLFPSISTSTRKCSKIHPMSSQVFFPPYYCFYLFQNLVIP